MTKRALFSIPSLLAAGLTPMAVSAEDDLTKELQGGGSFLDQLKSIVSNIDQSHTYTLAQHYSHQSHSSHSSHYSHRSYYGPPLPDEGAELKGSLERTSTRNEMSTPRSAILPNSPAIAKKLKVLPGNSKKFQDLVIRLQIALVARGYDVGEINGEVHARTVAAVYQYQNDSGMIPSGKMTSEVLGSLGIIAQ